MTLTEREALCASLRYVLQKHEREIEARRDCATSPRSEAITFVGQPRHPSFREMALEHAGKDLAAAIDDFIDQIETIFTSTGPS